MENYPEIATERFDNANFHIKYCLSIIKKYIKGDILEIGAGCGSFTRNYYKKDLRSITLTETDAKNIFDLKKNFKNFDNIKVSDLSVDKIEKKFDSILYFHVLEHIEDDIKEIEDAKKRLKVVWHLSCGLCFSLADVRAYWVGIWSKVVWLTNHTLVNID